MKRLFLSGAIVAVATIAPASAATYSLVDNIVGRDFYNAFEWQNIWDPTNGRVNYVDQGTSQNLNLTYASSDTFVLRTDFTSVLNPHGPGRNSVRIRSRKTYRKHVAVFDVRHMPQGCGTWPAIWETKEDGWPSGGEVDILEGVNDQGPNAATLHTTAGCTMPQTREQTGTSGQLDCNWEVNGNTGCGVRFATQTSYGPAFNSVRGGWFAAERTDTYIKVWFWDRNDPSVPGEIRNGAGNANPDTWGIPAAYFPDTSCHIPRFFSENNIIINLTLCGDWAGAVYGQSGCPGTCIDHVNNNPAAFKDAYFDFAAIRVYQ
ncbi:glycoside hydrolase family 16 protein [Hebeloma cylindrosporum]|uniref:Glycoside hydrolase family 16 protein n=1 Tax=Hebeloma cylindrosporum TaxID=76867 RepID=A0A0C2Y8N4_HEBCY|nr:glycoside hydrolase family 16 protein [Hebeloma cylindrosporum h7]